jgi:hypothetical protein
MNLADYAKPTNRFKPFTICGVPDCGKPHKALNLCPNHYAAYLKQRKAEGYTRSVMDIKDILSVVSKFEVEGSNGSLCGVFECEKDRHSKNLCVNHYARYNRWMKERTK